MHRFRGRSSKKAGLAPGTVVHVGEKRTETSSITVLDYDAEHFEERELPNADACLRFKETPTVTWLNVTGVHDTKLLERLGECYGIHPLVMEDVGNTDQRPKLEDHKDYLFIVVKMLYLGKDEEIVAEQVSLVVGPNFVISFQETGQDVFEPVRARLRSGKGRVRAQGADYLAYSLMDAVVDHYFVVLEKLGLEIEEIEDGLVESPGPTALQAIYRLKREMIFLRRSVWPLREVISGMERRESELIKQTTVVYLRDVYDHTIQVMDTIESYRDMTSGMLDTYLSSVSNRMNEVMKFLTIIATIFIPLTFLAGIYGMNFRFMPELGLRWGYPAVWVLMVLTAVGLWAYFRSRRWL